MPFSLRQRSWRNPCTRRCSFIASCNLAAPRRHTSSTGSTSHQPVKGGGDRPRRLPCLQAALAPEGSLAGAPALPAAPCPPPRGQLFLTTPPQLPAPGHGGTASCRPHTRSCRIPDASQHLPRSRPAAPAPTPRRPKRTRVAQGPSTPLPTPVPPPPHRRAARTGAAPPGGGSPPRPLPSRQRPQGGREGKGGGGGRHRPATDAAAGERPGGPRAL